MQYSETLLWKRLESVPSYVNTFAGVRTICSALGAKVAEQLPAYTDHSLKHMDALWGIAQAVLTEEQIQKLAPAEAFALGLSFYVHDLGMAITCTEQGLDRIKQTKEYKSEIRRLCFGSSSVGAAETEELLAVRFAIRETHAKQAPALLDEEIPGIDRFLIEDSDIREMWSSIVGEIAASHHWPIEKLEKEFGRKGVAASPDGEGTIDMGYVACLLRIIDFAHINRDRASSLELLLRPKLGADSLLHWKAQNRITGPHRDHDELKFTSTAPLDDLDAWWLFYDMANGLNNEIRAVHSYLRSRASSLDRFSLFGVRGVESPEAFAHLVSLSGDIQPLDIKVQPHSMSRVLDILGGKALYGGDNLAPLRELIQNSRDAIELRRALDLLEGRSPVEGMIDIKLEKRGNWFLSVSDNGVGMNKATVIKHLISVASDFWNSPEFVNDYAQVSTVGFRPIGKFGIGFLSVFMLGDEVEVTTEAAAHSRLVVSLKGISRRGQLRESRGSGQVGTTVSVKLHPQMLESLNLLTETTRARAPMLGCVIHVSEGTSATDNTVAPNWWKRLSYDEMKQYVSEWQALAFTGKKIAEGKPQWYYRRHGGSTPQPLMDWPKDRPLFETGWCKVWCTGADAGQGVIACSNGIAVGHIGNSNLTGIVELGPVELSAARNTPFFSALIGDTRYEHLPGRWSDQLWPGIMKKILESINELGAHNMMAARIDFLRHLATTFGTNLLLETTVAWLSVATPDGNIGVHSVTEVQKLINQHEGVLIVVGGTLIDAYQYASLRLSKEAIADALVIPIQTEEIDIGYLTKERIEHEHGTFVAGTLAEVLAIAEVNEATLQITHIVLEIIGSGWQATSEKMSEVQWVMHTSKKRLFLYLSRNEFNGPRPADDLLQ